MVHCKLDLFYNIDLLSVISLETILSFTEYFVSCKMFHYEVIEDVL